MLYRSTPIVTKLQNGEGIARKAGSGRFPHLSHVGKSTSKRSMHRPNIPAPTGLLQTWPHMKWNYITNYIVIVMTSIFLYLVFYSC